MSGERELIERASAGSEDAFSELVLAHQARIRAYLSRFVRQRDIADELAQDTFLEAYNSMALYRHEAPLRMWLIGIARHRALMYLRDEARRREKEGPSLRAALAGWRCSTVEVDAGRLAERSEELDKLAECLEDLPPRGRDLVDMYYTRSMNAAQIAEQTNEGHGAVRMQLLRLRQALRRCMEQRFSVQEA